MSSEKVIQCQIMGNTNTQISLKSEIISSVISGTLVTFSIFQTLCPFFSSIQMNVYVATSSTSKQY